MKRRQWGSMVLVGILAAGMLTGAQASAAEGEKKLEVEVGYTAEALDSFRLLMDGFTEETGISVDLVTPGTDYETVMKTRMASADMPDVFITHGWSINRYKEYLLELNDQAWVEEVAESIRSVISDKDGKIYVLCVTQGVGGMEYNQDVLAKVGVDPASIRTMDDFQEACAKIKEAGINPVFIGGKDYWTSANFMNLLAAAYYTADGCVCPSGEALKDGSFDWEADGMHYFNAVKDMINNGYFNENFITADEVTGIESLANGETAFLVGGIAVERAKSYNESANIGVMPVPATAEEGKSLYQVGEGSAFGIWKDSEYIEEAKQLLEYLARAEVAEQILAADANLPALNNINTAENLTYEAFTKSEKEFEGDICYQNLFDREFLPNGMWSVLSDSMIEVFMNPTEEGVQAAVEGMQENYVEKLEAAE